MYRNYCNEIYQTEMNRNVSNETKCIKMKQNDRYRNEKKLNKIKRNEMYQKQIE